MAGRKIIRKVNARSARRLKAKFLEAYSRLGNATAVEVETGISRFVHLRWLKQSSEYRTAFEAADDAATELLEIEARRRAIEGDEQAVYYNGVKIGAVRKFSDVLLIFLLKSKRPDVYRERYDARINGQINVQSAVKVVHEYHEAPAAIDVSAVPTMPNRALMSATIPGELAAILPVPEEE